MPSAGFEPAIPATKRPKTYTLYRAANGIVDIKLIQYFNRKLRLKNSWA
jgi:hypothetical protein